MAFGRWQLVVLLLLFFLVASSTAVPISRSLKTVKNQVLFGNFHSQDVKEIDKDDEVLEGRMNMELADYPGTGENHNHDPRPPGRMNMELADYPGTGENHNHDPRPPGRV